MKNISKDVPLAEITLRKYEKPSSKDRRDNVRKACLSLGLLQPGDSRDIIVDILYILLEARVKKRKMSVEEIQQEITSFRKKRKLSTKGVALSNIRRQLLRLRNISLVEKAKNRYRISEFSSLKEIFSERIKKYLLDSIVSRIEEQLFMLDSEFSE